MNISGNMIHSSVISLDKSLRRYGIDHTLNNYTQIMHWLMNSAEQLKSVTEHFQVVCLYYVAFLHSPPERRQRR